MTHPLRHTPSQQHRRAFVLLSLLLLLLCCNTMSAKERRPAVAVERLRVENMREPLGLDTAEPRFSWIITSAQNDVVQTAYHLIVSDDRGEVWNTGRVESRQQLWVPYRGLPLRSGQHLSWRLKVYTNRGETDWSAPQRFSIGLLTESRWGGRWIGLERLMPGEAAGVQHSRMAARYLRKVFTLRGKPVHRATAYVAGLGLYRLFVNQQEVGADEVLKPAPTDYRKTIYYQTYDVTSLMADTFAVGIVVGNGKYFAPRQNKPYKNTTFGLPKCRLNIIVEYADGSTQRLVTDETWRVTASGPIRANNEYDGEVYDARQELDGWLTTGYDDAHWLQAERTALPQGTLRGKVMNGLTHKSLTPGPSPMGEGSIYTQAQNHGQTQGTGLYTPLSHRRGAGGEALYDFRQNMAGWVSFMPAGRKGDTIRVRYAERLSADGSLYTDNLRDARSEDVYICNGHETQPWQPSFVYHGFRYAEVSGPATDVQAWFVADDMEHVGTFMCSDTILNRVVEAARWGIASNYKGVPVDCPQRNERQPWLGDRTVGALGESYLFDNERLYAKWTRDICEAQREDGTIPDVAPAFWNYYTDDVTWPAALPFICQMLHEQYGNDEPLRRCYPAMKRWALHMMQENMRDDLITKDKYGDWCMPPEKPELIHSQDPARQTDGTLIATAYMIRCLQLLRTFARHQQLSDDALYWQKRAEIMSDVFNRRFLHAAPGTSPRPGHTLYPDSTYYGNNTATANLLPLAFGIVPDTLRSEVAKQVVVNILEQNKGHVPCGVIGTSWLLRTLSDCGYGDVAYLIATQKTYPSWGYMVEQGATTIWELWNGDTADPAMNSGNHVMLLGDLLTWCFQYLGGVRVNTPEAPPSAPEGATIVSALHSALHSALGSIEAPSGAVGGAGASGAVGGAGALLSAEQISSQANLERLFRQREAFRRQNLPQLAANWQHSVFYQLDLDDAARSFREGGMELPAPLPDDAPMLTRMHDAMFRGDSPQAFSLLRQAIIGQLLTQKQQPRLSVCRDQIVWARSPVRIDIAGGWTDTPPFCLMEGGSVVNLAIELNGQPPLQAYVKPSERYAITLRSIDLGATEVVETYDELLQYNRVGSPFSIPKAALALAGFAPGFGAADHASLTEQLRQFGCGIELTLLSAIPAGSGLGTSSILAATVLGALSDFCDLAWDKSELCRRTLALEQLLTTGGGWQDQFGGVLGGVKLLQTQQGLDQNPVVRWLPTDIYTQPEWRQCHLLYYTGITRTAKHILDEIVRRMFLNHRDQLLLLRQMKEHAAGMFEALQQQRFTTVGRLLRQNWEQNQQLDSGTNPDVVRRLTDLVDDLCLGYKLPGAGGGGYLYMMAKDPEAAARIRRLLTANRPNANARFVDMQLSASGLQVSRS